MTKRSLAAVMRRIAKGKTSRRAAARALKVGVRQVNRLMLAHGVQRPMSAAAEERDLAHAEAEERRSMRRDNAQVVIDGNQDVADAAINAGCSERTIMRWVKKLSKPSKKPRKSRKPRRKSR
jgi:transposase-like protein